MTSSNFIEIDFSSVSYESLKSYSQLDAISNIRSNIAEDGLAENNVLGTNIQLQDTSLLTIPVHTPLRLSPPSCENNSFLISFKKFHVTRIYKSGYNKIYEFRRSKSFFFEIVDHHLDTNQLHLKIHTNDYLMSTTPIEYHSTSALPNAKYQISKGLQHFFSSQRVIPRRIQHKYFNMLRQKLLDRITFIKSREYKINNKNTITKTFFNFSYKRYRFHFGIFISCDHRIESKGLSLPPRCCEVPSPIVMSNNRYGCGLHFFKKYPDGLTFIRNDNGDFTPKIHPQNKELHAKLTFDRWIKKESKSIFSTRTGISYNFRYIVCNSNRKINPGRTHIYHKLMNNFRSTPSPNSRTAKKQQVRFERSCRRILSQEVIKPGAVSSTSTKLAAAKKGRFLFLPSQKFTAPLRHLHYKKTADIPKQKDYNFTIPHYFSANTNTSKELRTTRNTSNVTESTLIPASNDDLLYTVAPYNPTPDMFISIKYRDIIPPDPIYDNFGSFIVPGSREWFTYMYQLDLNTRDERLEKAEATKFNARMDELYAENQATKLRYQQHQEERSLNIKKLQLEEAARIQTLARYHGTSSNHVLYRQRQAVDLTQWNNDFHYDMSNPQRPTLSKYQKKKSKQKKKLLQSEMDSFLINYPGVSAPLSLKRNTTRSPFEYPYKTFDSEPYTSDDTKEIETRPLKRADHTFSNIHRSHDIYKRSRLDSPLALDSEQAGSSKSSF